MAQRKAHKVPGGFLDNSGEGLTGSKYPPGNKLFNHQWYTIGPGNTTTPSIYGNAHFRHADLMNTLFLDGHVEAVSPMRLVEATKRHSTLTALNRGFWIVHQNGKFEWWIW